jgi:hypothetical protein
MAPAASGSVSGHASQDGTSSGTVRESDGFDAFGGYDALAGFDAFRPPDTENRRQPPGMTGGTGTILSLYAGSSGPSEEPAAAAAPVAPAKDSAKKSRARWVKGKRVTPAAVEVDAQPAQAAGLPTRAPRTPTERPADKTAAAVSAQGTAAAQAESATKAERRKKVKPVKDVERHHDWLWELVGFVICVAIALIVFFAVPMIVTP